jgi:hypothetical protein
MRSVVCDRWTLGRVGPIIQKSALTGIAHSVGTDSLHATRSKEIENVRVLQDSICARRNGETDLSVKITVAGTGQEDSLRE